MSPLDFPQSMLDRYHATLQASARQLVNLEGSLSVGDESARVKIKALAHKIRGSGGTYGYPELSFSAKQVEYAYDVNLAEALKQLLEQIDRTCHAGTDEAENQEPRKLRALVVESNPLNASVIGNCLKTLDEVGDYTVVNSAVAACDELVKKNHDFMLLDLVLPDGDGREILRDISKVLGIRVPTLVMSRVTSDGLFLECMNMGATGYLTKLFATDSLRVEIERLVRECRNQQATPAAAPASPKPQPALPEKGAVLQGKKILIAEDDEMQAEAVSWHLYNEGAEVQICKSGAEALDCLKKENYSMVILDVRMPGMGGFTVLDTIRSQPRLAGLPVIMLTAMGSEEDVIRGFELGADDYILKPFSGKQLLARIKAFLRRKGPAA